jgi:mRNA interferase YafO
MTITVEYSSDTYDDLFKDVLDQYPKLEKNLLEDFRTYIASNRNLLPDYFGRDTSYTQPYEAFIACLMHIHIAIPPLVFPKNKPQYDRTCPGDPAKDAALVYVNGLLDEDHYVLIALLHPGAHSKARNEKVMKRLAAVAKDFRDTH